MEKETWKESVSPPEGGLLRLRARLDQAEKVDRQETIGIGAVTGLLAAALVSFLAVGHASFFRSQSSYPAAGRNSLVTINGQAVEMSGTPSGVHYYWVFTSSNEE